MHCELERLASATGAGLDADELTCLACMADPDLVQRVRSTAVTHVSARATPTGELALLLGGRALCSGVDPRAEAETWASHQDLEGIDLLLVFGLGPGYHIEALRARTPAPIVVLEPSLEVIRSTLTRRGLDLPDVRLVDNTRTLREQIVGRLHRAGQVVKIVAWPPHARLFASLWAAVQQTTRQAAELAAITANTFETRLQLWVRNLLQNLPQCAGRIPARGFAGQLQGRPAVLVAAGPSLDRNVEQLARYPERATVIAVNTAMGALERAGVRADFMVAVELLDVSSQLGRLELNRRCGRFLNLIAHPCLFDGPMEGPIFPFIDASVPHFRQLTLGAGLGEGIPAGGCAATIAFALASMMGADPIVLVGQDLAYTGERVYASGTVFEGMRAHLDGEAARLDGLEEKRRIGASAPGADTTRERVPVVPTEAWGGGTVWTTPEFAYFRCAFERWARGMPGVSLINATEGGAHIEGFVERPLGDVLRQRPRLQAAPLPDGPAIAASSIRTVLQRERDATLLVVREAQLATPRATEQLRGAVRRSGLVEAQAWSALQAMIRDPQASFEDLCRQLERQASVAAGMLDDALRRLP